MGSINNGPKLAAFQSDVYATGLDLRRSEINRDLGVFSAADAATFEQGQMVSLNASHEVVLADGGDVLGVAKHNKVNLQKGLNVDEEHVVAVSTTVPLARANVSNVVVRDAVDQGGSVISAAGDFTLNTTNGTLAWDASPAQVTDGQTVFVTYTYDMTNADYQFQGRNFFNFVDDVTIAEGRITVVMAPALIYTTHFDTSRTYGLTGANSNLYCGGTTAGLEGLFTNDSGEGAYVGRVVSLPSNEDPYMGVHFTNLPEEA